MRAGDEAETAWKPALSAFWAESHLKFGARAAQRGSCVAIPSLELHRVRKSPRGPEIGFGAVWRRGYLRDARALRRLRVPGCGSVAVRGALPGI